MRYNDFTPEPIFYFAYGMLTDPRNMEDATFVGPAILPNFKFEMLKYANVLPSSESKVHGTLWKLDRNVLGILDKIEGCPWLYNRKTVPVNYNGKKYIAELYTMTPETRDNLQGTIPEKSYVASLINGYRTAHLPLFQIRTAIENIDSSNLTKLYEVNMSPSALKDFSKTPIAQNMSMGFEAEMVVPKLDDGSNVRLKPDYSNDPPFPITDHHNNEEVLKFLWNDGKFSDPISWISLRLEKLTDDYNEFIDRKFNNFIYVSENGKEMFRNKIGQMIGSTDPDDITDEILNGGKVFDTVFNKMKDNYLKSQNHFKNFLNFNDISTVSDFARTYSIRWPYRIREPNNGMTVEDLANNFKDYTGFNVVASNDYHAVKRKPGLWIFEPDASISATNGSGGIELISPPMKLQKAFDSFDVFWDWANTNKITANATCGFHVGVSLPSQSTKDIDAVKLILFLGDSYVLQSFERQTNQFTTSIFERMKQKAINRFEDDWRFDNDISVLKAGIGSAAHNYITKMILPMSDHYFSVNIRNNYIEFRAAGGNYFEDKDKIYNTIFRYIKAMDIASDPNANRNEYLKKLYKFLSTVIAPKDEVMELFIKYATGKVSTEVLKILIKRFQNRREQSKNNDY